jgi:hypothetical protein
MHESGLPLQSVLHMYLCHAMEPWTCVTQTQRNAIQHKATQISACSAECVVIVEARLLSWSKDGSQFVGTACSTSEQLSACMQVWAVLAQVAMQLSCRLGDDRVCIGSIACFPPLPRKPAHGWRQSEAIVKTACVLCAVRCCCCHCEKAGNGLDHGRSSVSGASDEAIVMRRSWKE